jgi:hypothetical protein
MSATEQALLEMLETPEFGGPSDIRLDVDRGPFGKRGTFILLSNGDPNDPLTIIANSYPPEGVAVTTEPNPDFQYTDANVQLYDICLPLNRFDPSYLTVFIYQDGPQGVRWYPSVRLAPEGFPGILDGNFLDGISPVFALTQLPLIAAQQIAAASLSPSFDLDTYLTILESQLSGILNINLNIINENPIALSIVPNPGASSPISIFYTDPMVTQYAATIQSNSKEIVLSSGNTASLNVGQKLFKQSGIGDFGQDPIITSILSNTRFTVSSSHVTAGPIVFASANAFVSLDYLAVATEYVELEELGFSWIPLQGPKKIHILIGIAFS